MPHQSGELSDIFAPRSQFYEGPYGRMFRNLPPHVPAGGDAEIRDLAETMVESPAEAEDKARDNDTIPSGYIYFGQFVAHDITFDPTSSLQRRNDPDKLYNFRTPRFDLDSLYGGGPKASPYMFDRKGYITHDGTPCAMLIGHGNNEREADLPRNHQERALIGDLRNDENVIVSQIHLAFLKFHNRVVRELFERKNALDSNLLAEAQRIVRWHYQWVVVHDFLKRVVGKETYERVLPDAMGDTRKPRLRFYKWKNQPYIPIEFSVAAFRFGHTMLRPDYALSDPLEDKRGQEKKSRKIPLFRPMPGIHILTPDDLSGFRRLEKHWTIQWNRFLEDPDPFTSSQVQLSRRINSKLSSHLVFLPFVSQKDQDEVIQTKIPSQRSRASLAVRNLTRGRQMELPSGQCIARAMGYPIPDALRPAQDDPLWYFILKEAGLPEELGGPGGKNLGPVGGTIVAEVILGLLASDPFSYLNMEPLWTPNQERVLRITEKDNPYDFQLFDMLKYAKVPMNKQEVSRYFNQ